LLHLTICSPRIRWRKTSSDKISHQSRDRLRVSVSGTRHSVWAPKAVALIGKLPTTLQDRSIIVAMRRNAILSSQSASPTPWSAPNYTIASRVPATLGNIEVSHRIVRIATPIRRGLEADPLVIAYSIGLTPPASRCSAS
jgi:hypothetical protein